MNFKEDKIIYKPKVRESIYHSVIKSPKNNYYLYSNQWNNLYQTVCLKSLDNGITFSKDECKVIKNSGASHNFFPFYGKGNCLYGVGGVDNWKYDEEFYNIWNYDSFVKVYEEKFRKSSKDQKFSIAEHRRLLSDKKVLNHTRGLYLFKSEDGKEWKQVHKQPIITVFNEGFINSINLFGKSSEFDGHVNCIYDKNLGRYIIYVRANVSQGYRFIQYATSKDLVNWSKFNLINLDIYNCKEDNYYTPCMMKYRDLYIGLVPYLNYNGFCSIRLITSLDGITWKFIKDFYKDKTVFFRGEKPKNTRHFVNGFVEQGDELYFYLHNNYFGLTKKDPVTIQRLSINKKEFEKVLHYGI